MGNLTVFQNAQLPAAFRQGPIAGMGDLTEGVSAGFPVVSFKGKVWKIKARGEEHLWLNHEGMPVPYVDAVIVNGSSHVSKQFYAKKFADGEEAGAPDCWSLNGVRPDKSIGTPLHTSCASCAKNQWGSRISDSGKQAKACQDNRRVAIVPLSEVLSRNEAWGGPMLLRIPPTSLQELAGFQKQMKNLNFPYYAVAVRISFDLNLAFPKLIFTPLRPLNQEEAEAVVEMATSEATQRMLNEAVDHDTAEQPEQPNAESVFLQGTGGITAPQAVMPQPTAAVTPAAPVTVQPAPATPPAPANDENPLVGQLRGMVEQGIMSKEQFKAATGVDFDPPAPKVEAAPWTPKPEHVQLALLIEAGSLPVEMFEQVSGYKYEGKLPAANPTGASPAPQPAPAPTEPKPTRTRKKAEPAASAPVEQVTDAEFTEKPAPVGLDAALDAILK